MFIYKSISEVFHTMELSRKQFDLLVAFAEAAGPMTQHDIEHLSGYSLETIHQTVKDLWAMGYLADNTITQSGLQALEPYRVKRAIFIAAGFGSRLAPITFNTPKPLVRVHGKRIIDGLIDACLEAGITDITIVRGYLAEQFDQLLYKYPMIRFLENPNYNEANSISSSMCARTMLSNAYVFEGDLFIKNPKIIKKYHYTSDFLAFKKDRTDDWCFTVENGIITGEKVGGLDCWQVVGISYWNEEDGHKLAADIPDAFASPGGKELFWEQVPLLSHREHYRVEICPCLEEDIVEIDTFRELKAIDKAYDV